MKIKFLLPLALAAALLTAQPALAQSIDELFQQGDISPSHCDGC